MKHQLWVHLYYIQIYTSFKLYERENIRSPSPPCITPILLHCWGPACKLLRCRCSYNIQVIRILGQYLEKIGKVVAEMRALRAKKTSDVKKICRFLNAVWALQRIIRKYKPEALIFPLLQFGHSDVRIIFWKNKGIEKFENYPLLFSSPIIKVQYRIFEKVSSNQFYINHDFNKWHLSYMVLEAYVAQKTHSSSNFLRQNFACSRLATLAQLCDTKKQDENSSPQSTSRINEPDESVSKNLSFKSASSTTVTSVSEKDGLRRRRPLIKDEYQPTSKSLFMLSFGRQN